VVPGRLFPLGISSSEHSATCGASYAIRSTISLFGLDPLVKLPCLTPLPYHHRWPPVLFSLRLPLPLAVVFPPPLIPPRLLPARHQSSPVMLLRPPIILLGFGSLVLLQWWLMVLFRGLPVHPVLRSPSMFAVGCSPQLFRSFPSPTCCCFWPGLALPLNLPGVTPPPSQTGSLPGLLSPMCRLSLRFVWFGALRRRCACLVWNVSWLLSSEWWLFG